MKITSEGRSSIEDFSADQLLNVEYYKVLDNNLIAEII